MRATQNNPYRSLIAVTREYDQYGALLTPMEAQERRKHREETQDVKDLLEEIEKNTQTIKRITEDLHQLFQRIQ